MMWLRRLHAIILLLACAYGSAISTVAQEKPLDNADIVKLTKLDMGDAVIIAKIKSAKQVTFDTSPDDLAKLQAAGVSKSVILVMIERGSPVTATAPGGTKPAGAAGAKVTLQTVDRSFELIPLPGLVKGHTGMFGFAQWVEFVDAAAKIRTTDHKPTILLASDADPRGGGWWFVRTAVAKDDDGDRYRYFDLEGGGVFSMTWSGAPEKGAIVKYDAVQEGPGLWRLTPQKELKPGEYGLFSGKVAIFAQGEGTIFDFGIDK